MLTLTEFLLARIAEDEAAAGAARPAPWGYQSDDYGDGQLWSGDDSSNGIAHASWEHSGEQTAADLAHIARHDPARVLAECEAKRAIVQVREALDQEARRVGLTDYERATDVRATRIGLDVAIKALATVYADHPDCRAEWVA